jgi:cytochrome c-type biogenesis protein CcmH
MLLWLIFALLTALVLAVVLRPLVRTRASGATDDSVFDRAVYQDQLSELEREQEEGIVPRAEAQAARAEIARRLLAADRGDTALPETSPVLRRASLLITVLSVPLFALGVYALRGSPNLAGVPHAQRLANAEINRDLEALIAKVEAHLAEHPADAQGWRVLAPAYRSLQRYDAAARAYERALSYGKPEAALLADLGEVLVMASQGLVTKAAAESFAAAVKLDPKHPKARYFQALAMWQEGKADAALKAWRAMVAEAPAGAPWRMLVESQIARADLQAVAPNLGQPELAAAEGMTGPERTRMIRAMVEGLAKKLEQDGADLDGWLRLARARMVMGEPEGANHALDRASEIFRTDHGAIARIEELRKSLQPE